MIARRNLVRKDASVNQDMFETRTETVCRIVSATGIVERMNNGVLAAGNARRVVIVISAM